MARDRDFIFAVTTVISTPENPTGLQHTKERRMADTEDLKSHEEMWKNFTRLVLYSAIGIAVVLLLMRLFLV
jgi:hypothetical protein